MGKTSVAIADAEAARQKNKDSQEALIRSIWLPPPAETGVKLVPDQINRLTVKLLHRLQGNSIKTLLVVGWEPGDGATTTAINLATALSLDFGRCVLLVDANMRDPGLHGALRTGRTGGLSELLLHDRFDWRNLKRVGPGELYLLPGGIRKCNGPSCFATPRFDRLINACRQRFDIVLLDTAPAALYPDALAIASKIDGTLIVMRHGRIRRQAGRQMAMDFRNAGANLLGVVANRRQYYIPEWIYQRL